MIRKPIDYLPMEERIPNWNYHELLSTILQKGKKKRVIHGEYAYTLKGHLMRFDMKNGFPVITERKISEKMFKGALGEHIGFMHGARTLEQLEAFGCPKSFWERWVTKEKCGIFGLNEGDLGDGSYGAAWANFPTNDGRSFNQIKNLIDQIKERPFLRTHEITPWIPFYTASLNPEFPRRVVVAPCHGWIHLHVDEDDKTLAIEHRQRSADAPVGLVFNLIQYASFGLMVAQMLGYEFTELIYYITDAHIYESQMRDGHIEKLLSSEPKKFGTVYVDESIKNLLDFRPEHFVLKEYEAHKYFNIPTPI